MIEPLGDINPARSQRRGGDHPGKRIAQRGIVVAEGAGAQRQRGAKAIWARASNFEIQTGGIATGLPSSQEITTGIAGAGDPGRVARPDDPRRRGDFLATRQAGRDPAGWISKFNTLAQIAFAALALGARAFGYDDSALRDSLAWVVAASTLASGGVYIAQWLDHMSR